MRTRKTMIDGGSPWRWYAEPERDGTYLAMATVIELRSVWSLPRFEWYSRRVHRQLGQARGLLGYSFRGRFPLWYWTLSAWEDGRALRAFVKGGAHVSAMAPVSRTMRQFQHVHWKVTGGALPLSWAEGLRRLERRNGAGPASSPPRGTGSGARLDGPTE